MYFEQFKVDGLGCYSYLAGCPQTGEAFVVDPQRDVDHYLQAAEANGLTITDIFDTHLHADHVSGAVALAVRTGATIRVSPAIDPEYRYEPLKDGGVFTYGAVRVEAIDAPGHTPNSVVLALTDATRSQEPGVLLTGDLLFVGDVGRPDLAGPELLDEQVRNLYDSLYEKLKRFADWVEVYPAHGAGSLCGKSISPKPMTTLGFERLHNPLLNGMPFDEFKEIMTSGFRRRPPAFESIVAKNRRGAVPLQNLRPLDRMSNEDIENARGTGAALVDVRHGAAFGAAHIPGSVNIGPNPHSASWLGMVLDTERDLVLVADSEEVARNLALQFRRVAFDNILGFTGNGISAWAAAGKTLDHLPQLSVQSLAHVLDKYPDHVLVDVRTQDEWVLGHIDRAMHVPLDTLVREGLDVAKDRHVTTICRSGYRSNIAGSYLKAQGFAQVFSVIGGMTAWQNAFPDE